MKNPALCSATACLRFLITQTASPTKPNAIRAATTPIATTDPVERPSSCPVELELLAPSGFSLLGSVVVPDGVTVNGGERLGGLGVAGEFLGGLGGGNRGGLKDAGGCGG